MAANKKNTALQGYFDTGYFRSHTLTVYSRDHADPNVCQLTPLEWALVQDVKADVQKIERRRGSGPTPSRELAKDNDYKDWIDADVVRWLGSPTIPWSRFRPVKM
jgi:hypothetical protein